MYKGSTNQRVIDLKKSVNNVELWEWIKNIILVALTVIGHWGCVGTAKRVVLLQLLLNLSHRSWEWVFMRIVCFHHLSFFSVSISFLEHRKFCFLRWKFIFAKLSVVFSGFEKVLFEVEFLLFEAQLLLKCAENAPKWGWRPSFVHRFLFLATLNL